MTFIHLKYNCARELKVSKHVENSLPVAALHSTNWNKSYSLSVPQSSTVSAHVFEQYLIFDLITVLLF